VQLTAGDFLKEEMDVAQQLVKDFPVDVSALALLGNAYAGQGNSVEAVNYWEKCLKLNAKYAPAYYRLGMNAMRKAEYEEAIGLWRKAVSIDPSMSGVHGGLGRALLYLGKPKEAVLELEEDIRISPQDGLEYFLLGQTYLQLNECAKAKPNYEKAAQLQPDDARVYYGLATVYDKLGESEKAKEYQERFRKLKTEESIAFNRELGKYDDRARLRARVVLTHASAGEIYRRAGRLPQAEAHLRRALALDPKNAVSLRELATLCQSADREQDALELRERLWAVEPGDIVNLLNIAVGNARLQRFSAAETAYRQVIKLAPNQFDGYEGLAKVLLKTARNLPEAKSLAETAVRLQSSAANYRLLSEACDKNGDSQGALSAMERAIALEPNNEQYQRIYAFLKKGK
jgi:tetratricopeptide (TPR) repeat protein